MNSHLGKCESVPGHSRNFSASCCLDPKSSSNLLIFQALQPEVPGGGCAPIDSLLGRDLSGFPQQESTLFLRKRFGQPF